MRIGAKGNASANRADDVRKRRTERSQERVSSATQRAAHPVRVRPVVVRGNEFGTPIHKQSNKHNPRRAFYVTMDSAAGSELRLPSIPMVHPGWRLLSGAIAIAALVGIYSFWNSEFFRVISAEVTGPQRISAEEMNGVLKLENLSVIEIDTSVIKKELTKAYPELIDVQVAVEMPNIVSVSASERQPVIAWQRGDQLQWLDAEGVIFPARGDAGPLVTIQSEDSLPMVAIIEDPEAVATQTAEAGKSSAEEQKAVETPAPRNVDPMLIAAAQTLSQKLPPETVIVYSTQNGLGWNDPQGWQVFIGTDLSNFEEKYGMYQGLANHLARQGETPVLISVEHLNAPFYRLEP